MFWMDYIFQNNAYFQLVGSQYCDFFVSDGHLELKISNYHYLKNMPKEAWAWEFTRRNSEYITAWAGHIKQCQKQSFLPDDKDFKKNEMKKASKFGLLYFIDPNLGSKTADLFWSPEIMPYVLSCSLIDHESDEYESQIILADISLELSYVETFDGNSHLILKDECCSIQLLFDEKLDLNTVFDFEVHLPVYCDLVEKIQSVSYLCEFLSYQKCRKFHSLSTRKTIQYIEVLFAFDLLKLGLSHREIAIRLYGESAILEGWDGVSDNTRSKTRRIIKLGEELVVAGYISFLNLSKK